LPQEVRIVEIKKVTLVTVVAVFELGDRLMKDLKALGVKGYTTGRVDGRGVHGRRLAGLVDASNIRIEMLVEPALSKKILDRIAKKYEDQPIMAFVHDVEAML
jgi:nitrogen regulatory protein PII